jgi:uncharacterized membrane protein
MELVIIISTITSFFSHHLIERAVVANSVSVVFATLFTWLLVGNRGGNFNQEYFLQLLIVAVIALVISMIVGLVFAYHKKCSKR